MKAGLKKRLFGGIAMTGSVLLAAATLVGPSGAATGGNASTPTVYFIGDSYTAGFGYGGVAENAPSVTLGVNALMANAWYFGDNSLADCEPTTPPNDACSNNNDNGAPWNAGVWIGGANAPTIAYPYQIAQDQATTGAVNVEDWAISGSTPAQWDPTNSSNLYGSQLNQIHDSTVIMTLGGNPLLDDFLDISVAGFNQIQGVCSKTTSSSGFFGTTYAQTPAEAAACAQAQWNAIDQGTHLANVYKALLANGDRVLVLGYPTACAWSFGNWQPSGSLVNGPSSGDACSSETAQADDGTTTVVSQLDQASGVGSSVDDMIAGVVQNVQAQDPTDAANLAYAPPSSDWINHQFTDSDPWFFGNDTWIHPNAEGHAQLALQAEGGMCSAFHQWCGRVPQWASAPQGYYLATANGAVDAYGAPAYGSLTGQALNASIVGIATTPSPDSPGYWLAGADGGVFAFGGAPFLGSLGALHLNAPIVGIASTPDGGGYWLVGADGGVFAFGDAAYDGSMGGQPLNQPVVGMAPTRDGQGYWLVARDGGVFAFGSASFYGSMGGQALAAPVVAIAANPTGSGYWTQGADGGIFSFDQAGFIGSLATLRLNQPTVGMAPTFTGQGYWQVAADGGVFAQGDAQYLGSASGQGQNVVGMATT